MTDSEITALSKESPQQWHRALFDEYYSYVYAISVNILRGIAASEDIEECVIDVFASVIRELDIGGDTALKPFIGTVAKHKAISMRRSLAARAGKCISIDSEDFGELPSEECIERRAESSVMTELLLQKIKELGEPDSSIIVQKYFYERNAREIGDMLGMSHTAVRVRCARAVKKLRSLLEGTDKEELL